MSEGLNEFTQLEPSNAIAELVSLIEGELPLFPASNEFVSILESKKNENQHSLSFCVYMTNKCSSKFYFARENSQKGASVIDIGIYKGHVLIYTIEAKLLPTPKGTVKNPRSEHEYVYGKGGGIQRFKDEKHGVSNTNVLLKENGILGFIKEQDFEHWLEVVNQWVVDSTWGEAEKLSVVFLDTIGRLDSVHIRKNKTFVNLNHFWIKVF